MKSPIETAAIAGSASPLWAPDTRIAVYGSGSTAEWYLVQATASFRYVGASLATARADPAGPVIGRSGVENYARDYEGISGVIHPAGTDASYRVGFTHAERHCRTAGSTWKTLASVGLVTSTNSGKSWTRRGQLISSQTVTTECTGFTGVGQPSAIVSGGYVWVFFTDWTPGRANMIAVARAPIASASTVSAYRKYNGAGTWTAARRGADVAVIARPSSSDVYAAAPSVSWNSTMGTFLAVFETNLGFDMRTSSNLLAWSSATRLLTFPKPKSTAVGSDPWWSYPTLLSSSAPGGSTGSSNYLYFARGVASGTPPHQMARVWTPIGTPALPGNVTIPAGRSFRPSIAQAVFAWVCSGDVTVSAGGWTTMPFDSDPTTGLVVGLSPGSELETIMATWGATCTPAYPSSLAAGESAASNLLRTVSGCGLLCVSVTTVRFDVFGHPELGPLPAAVQLSSGDSFLPSGPRAAFGWTCTGDLVATVGGNTTVLYDSGQGSSGTGLVVGMAAGAPVAVRAPFGASCAASDPWNLAAATDAAAAAAKSSGCGGSCVSVREVRFDATGAKVVDIWR